MHQTLNERQQTVLDWVGQGCPDGVWQDSTFKVSAQALGPSPMAVDTRSLITRRA